jgi:dUTP pyrophosphatase
MILTPVIKMELQEIDELPETMRGEGGFGSTGK